jgi:hypothetical protein
VHVTLKLTSGSIKTLLSAPDTLTGGAYDPMKSSVMNYGSPIVLMYDVVWSRARTRYYCVLMIGSTINHAAKMRVVDW